MGKLAKRLKELRNEPSKYDLDHQVLVENQKELKQNQEALITALNQSVVQINTLLGSLSNSIKAIKLDVDLSGVDNAISEVKDAVSGINLDVDLSGIEGSIKNIKPTDLTQLTEKLDVLLTSVQSIEIPESKELDLSPVLERIEGPRRVKFKVTETNSHGLPVEVTAIEQ